MIVADRVGLRVRGRALLDGVSLRLRPGTLTAVLGPNGAGKTTLLRVMTGALRPDTGQVLLDQAVLHRLDSGQLARRRAVLSQHHAAEFGLLARDVVALGRLPYQGRREAAQDGAALDSVRQAFGLAALWDQPLPTLSGGERQRVHLARAAAQIWQPSPDRDGRALFLDEPAAALDMGQQRMALAFAVRMARAGAAVLAVLHDPNHALLADAALLLRDGRVLASGPAQDVLTPQHLEACFGVAIEAVRRQDGTLALLT